MSAEQTPDIERVLAETLTLAVMHYYGFTDKDIAAAEQVHPGRVCDEDECFDEDGASVHGQAWVELGATANTVVEAVLPALAPVLAAAVREAEQRAWLQGYEFVLRNLQDEAVQADLQRLTAGVNAGLGVVSVPPDGAADAPNKAKGALAQQPPAPAVTYPADRVAEPQHEAATSGKESEASDE